MNQSTYFWMLGELRSAACRTDLRGAAAGVSFRLTGRCSPYLSHRGVEFGPGGGGADSPLWVTFRDPAEGIALGTPEGPETWADDPDTVGEAVQVPTEVLRPLVDGLRRELGPWLPGLRTWPLTRCVVVRRRLVGWTDDGRPVLAGLAGRADDGRPIPAAPEQAPAYGLRERTGADPVLDWARANPNAWVTLDDAVGVGLCADGVLAWLRARGWEGRQQVRADELLPHAADPAVYRVLAVAYERTTHEV